MESIEHRALKIAAKIMVAAELCRYNDRGECHLYCQGVADCDKCVEQWLRNKARKELFEEITEGTASRTSPLCPYCGAQMTLVCLTGHFPPDITRQYKCLRCGSEAPWATSDADAHKKAMRRRNDG